MPAVQTVRASCSIKRGSQAQGTELAKTSREAETYRMDGNSQCMISSVLDSEINLNQQKSGRL